MAPAIIFDAATGIRALSTSSKSLSLLAISTIDKCYSEVLSVDLQVAMETRSGAIGADPLIFPIEFLAQ
jgi:hypothetical protein